MERIKRALELARLEREQVTSRSDVPAQPAPASAVLMEPEHPLQAWRTPVVQVDAVHLARERILPAGSAGVVAAPYKLLRTQLLYRLEQLHANTLAIVSARSGEGKTLTAINLAITMAADPNRTTLLVDFDLRNPDVAQRFGIVPSHGAEEILNGKSCVEEALLRPSGYDRLTLLPASGRTEHSSELLGSPRAVDLVAELRDRYSNRVVLFDLPPVLETDDALAFSRHIQAALIVISEGKTRRDDVARTIQLLGNVPVVGTLLNGSRGRPTTHY